MKSKQITIVIFIAALISCFFYFDMHQYLTLEYLKEQRQYFESLIAAHPVISAASFAMIYILTTALSLPGAAILTLAAGALFGILYGTVIVSFASTIGATIAFMVARFLIKDSVQAKFGNRLQAINEGVENEGAFYLFTLRLVPAFPFFMINLLMGLTPISVLKFFIVSQVGMLPGTIVYVNAGTQLSKLDSLQGIVSPQILASFVLLGLFPIITKRIMSLFKKNF